MIFSGYPASGPVKANVEQIGLQTYVRIRAARPLFLLCLDPFSLVVLDYLVLNVVNNIRPKTFNEHVVRTKLKFALLKTTLIALRGAPQREGRRHVIKTSAFHSDLGDLLYITTWFPPQLIAR